MAVNATPWCRRSCRSEKDKRQDQQRRRDAAEVIDEPGFQDQLAPVRGDEHLRPSPVWGEKRRWVATPSNMNAAISWYTWAKRQVIG